MTPTAPQEEFILLFDDVGTQGAPYGSTNSLRTITTFYPVLVGSSVPLDRRSGLTASIRHEDGTFDTYDYSLVTNLWGGVGSDLIATVNCHSRSC